MHKSSILGIIMTIILGTGCQALIKFDRDKIGADGGGGHGGSGGSGGDAGNGGAAGAGGTGEECGNGVIEEGEECDDANTVNGDGCEGCKIGCGCGGCVAGTPCTACGPAVGAIQYEDPATGHCYLYLPGPFVWDAARAQCQLWGGDLAAPSTEAEMTAIAREDLLTVFANGGSTELRLWLGATDDDIEGAFQWVNGESWKPAPEGPSWAANNPNGGTTSNCLSLGWYATVPHARMHDKECTVAFPLLCERP